MRTVWTVIAAAILLLLAYVILSIIVAYAGGDIWVFPVPDSWSLPDSWAEWRDIAIVFSSAFWAIAGLVLIALFVVLVLLVIEIQRLIRENVTPAVDSLRGTLDNVRGTTEFAGETVASPMIRAYSVVRGVRDGASALGSLGGNITRRKKKRGIFR